jgi:hypothetical protein
MLYSDLLTIYEQAKSLTHYAIPAIYQPLVSRLLKAFVVLVVLILSLR